MRWREVSCRFPWFNQEPLYTGQLLSLAWLSTVRIASLLHLLHRSFLFRYVAQDRLPQLACRMDWQRDRPRGGTGHCKSLAWTHDLQHARILRYRAFDQSSSFQRSSGQPPSVKRFQTPALATWIVRNRQICRSAGFHDIRIRQIQRGDHHRAVLHSATGQRTLSFYLLESGFHFHGGR